MHPFVPRPDPFQVLSRTEQLAQQERGSTLGLVFQGINSVCLGVITTKMLVDMIRDQAGGKRHAKERG